MDRTHVTESLKAFILEELIRNPDYPLMDDEPLISGGLIDSFSLTQIGVFVEETFEVYIPDTGLTVENMDTLSLMVDHILKTDTE